MYDIRENFKPLDLADLPIIKDENSLYWYHDGSQIKPYRRDGKEWIFFYIVGYRSSRSATK